MVNAAALLLIATALGSDPTSERATTSEALDAIETVDETPAEVLEESTLLTDATPTGTGAGDPLYDRLFAPPEGGEGTADATQPTLPRLPPLVWVLGMAGLGGLYWYRQRQRQQRAPAEGQVEVLGHTRMGPKARLTVIRVQGEDGRMRRLLVSTGEGTPALVADLGAEPDEAEVPATSPAAATPVAPPPARPVRPFHQALDEAVSIEDGTVQDSIVEDDIIDDEEADLAEGEGMGFVPPPRVPVWNETPDEYASERSPRVAAPTATRPRSTRPAPPAPAEPSAPWTALEALDAMLDDGDAPEMVLDVAWDPESGWRGLPDLAPAQAPAPAEPADSWDDLQQERAAAEEPLSGAEVRPASRAAFEALLTRNGRASEPRPVRPRPVIHTVKPVRPRQAAPVRRTPYDDRIMDEMPEPTPLRVARSQHELHDLVAEVLEERSDAPAEPVSASGNGVVELARYLRRQVSP